MRGAALVAALRFAALRATSKSCWAGIVGDTTLVSFIGAEGLHRSLPSLVTRIPEYYSYWVGFSGTVLGFRS